MRDKFYLKRYTCFQVAQLRKESRKNANLIRSLEAETRLKEQVRLYIFLKLFNDLISKSLDRFYFISSVMS